jgi:catechol 2,3-dioxygenase-like lactoylglutathione lyase family enzyme
MPEVTVNHVGLCVTDLDRSRRFYTGALGFTEDRTLQPPDVYLSRGTFILELLHFDRPGNPAARDRTMTEPGLTHLSFTTDDLAASKAAVGELGGEVLEDTDVRAAVMVRDPDGQLLELIQAT